METEKLSVGEFQRTIDPIRQLIVEGFALVHQKQDLTNGRLRQAEQTIEVLSKARVIDAVADHEKRLGSMETADRIIGAAQRVLIGLAASIVGGVTVGVTIMTIRWWVGWH